jgi:hypothetical protein
MQQSFLKHSALEQFTGISKCHRISRCPFFVTDGVNFLTQCGNAGRLVFKIAFFQRRLVTDPLFKGYLEMLQGSQIWRFWANSSDKPALLACSSADNVVVFAGNVPSLDFPPLDLSLVLSNRVLSLPNEYFCIKGSGCPSWQSDMTLCVAI